MERVLKPRDHPRLHAAVDTLLENRNRMSEAATERVNDTVTMGNSLDVLSLLTLGQVVKCEWGIIGKGG